MERRTFLEMTAAAVVLPLGGWRCSQAPMPLDATAGLMGPTSWDDDGLAYTSSFGEHAIDVVDQSGQRLRTIGGSPDGLPGLLHNPTVVAVAPGRLLVVEVGPGSVRMLDLGGNDLGALGGADGFVAPRDICVDGDRIIVADAFAHNVRTFTGEGEPLETLGELGAGPKDLNAPLSVAVDVDGRLHVVDFGHRRIQVFRDRRWVMSYGQEILSAPRCVRAHPDGSILLLDRGALLRFSAAGELLEQTPADGGARFMSVAPDGGIGLS